jgi:hypothetical protein
MVDFVANLGLQDFEIARQIDGDFRLLAIDRTDFKGDFKPVLGGFAAAIAGHGFHRGLPVAGITSLIIFKIIGPLWLFQEKQQSTTLVVFAGLCDRISRTINVVSYRLNRF